MRTFYIFKVNDMFQTKYNSKTNALYKLFKEIYDAKETDILNSYKLFKQITLPFNRKSINNYILLKHGNDLYYNIKNNIHTISNAYEISRLKINTTYLKIKTNKNLNSFIKDIIDIKDNLFVIDFENNDYFWTNEINIETLV